MAPGQYLLQAQARAESIGVRLRGSPADIQKMIKDHCCHIGDIFFDDSIAGNVLERPGLAALMREVENDRTVSHIFIQKRERLARPDDPSEGIILENGFRKAGITIVFNDRCVAPLKQGRRDDIGDSITAYIEYYISGKFRDDHAEKMVAAKVALAQCGFSAGGRPPYGFRRCLVSSTGEVVRELLEGERVRMASRSSTGTGKHLQDHRDDSEDACIPSGKDTDR